MFHYSRNLRCYDAFRNRLCIPNEGYLIGHRLFHYTAYLYRNLKRFLILPNCLSSVIVLATLTLGDTILIAASLSFIGLGAQPPTPEWGAMISVGRKFLMDQWWYATFPGLFILMTVIGFNILGDALRDIMDPRIRR